MSRGIAVVLASVGRGPASDRSVAAFLREVKSRGEVVVVEGGSTTAGPHSRPGLRFLASPQARLVPAMWRARSRGC